MKRLLPKLRPRRSKRRGALFHYYLAYVTLTSSILILAGICLHTILQSDQTDRRVALFLNSLRRCETILRRDANEAAVTLNSNSKITLNARGGDQIEWNSDRGIVTRTETSGGETFSSDRFVFPAGSRVEMESRPNGAIVVRFVEPSAFVKYSAVGSGGLNQSKPVEEALPPTPRGAAAQPVVEVVLQSQTEEISIP